MFQDRPPDVPAMNPRDKVPVPWALPSSAKLSGVQNRAGAQRKVLRLPPTSNSIGCIVTESSTRQMVRAAVSPWGPRLWKMVGAFPVSAN